MFPLPLPCRHPNGGNVLCKHSCSSACIPQAAKRAPRITIRASREEGAHTSQRQRGRGSPRAREPAVRQSWAEQHAAAALGALAAVSLTLAGSAGASGAEATELSGLARTIDGDTLEVGGKKVRLYGLDAPESKQLCRDAGGREYACGQQVADALRAKIGSSQVQCQVRSRDQYGRSVAACRAGGQDINGWLVESGLAVAYRQYGTEYVGREDAAHAAKRGLWGGSFQTPADWRKERKIEQLQQSLAKNGSQALPSAPPVSGPSDFQLDPSQCSTPSVGGRISAFCARLLGRDSTAEPGSAPAGAANCSSTDRGATAQAIAKALGDARSAAGPPPPGCAIKGNISANGKIFHVPGGSAYDRTQIDKSAGERWFCSEAEAQAAGWRKAKS